MGRPSSPGVSRAAVRKTLSITIDTCVAGLRKLPLRNPVDDDQECMMKKTAPLTMVGAAPRGGRRTGEDADLRLRRVARQYG